MPARRRRKEEGGGGGGDESSARDDRRRDVGRSSRGINSELLTRTTVSHSVHLAAGEGVTSPLGAFIIPESSMAQLTVGGSCVGDARKSSAKEGRKEGGIPTPSGCHDNEAEELSCGAAGGPRK